MTISHKIELILNNKYITYFKKPLVALDWLIIWDLLSGNNITKLRLKNTFRFKKRI